MKHIIALLMAAATSVSAADLKATKEVKPQAKPSVEWYNNVSIAPVGAIRTEHLDGPSHWGAGLELGYAVNPFVGIKLVNLSFEDAGSTVERKTKKGLKSSTIGEGDWGGLLVDETALQIDSKISRFSNETFSLHLVGGGQTDWNDNDYGVNVGLKVAMDFNKHVALSGGYSIRTWFKGDTRVDSLLSAALNFSF